MKMSLAFLSAVGLFLGIEQQKAFAEEYPEKVAANNRPSLVSPSKDWKMEKSVEAFDVGEEGGDWSAWHKRIDSAVEEHFERLAESYFEYHSPLMTKVAYVVTKNGEIKDVRSVAIRTGEIDYVHSDWEYQEFDSFIRQSVRSLSGQKALLAFPECSKKDEISKVAEYMHYYIQKDSKPISDGRGARFLWTRWVFLEERPRLPRGYWPVAVTVPPPPRAQNPFVRPVESGGATDRILQSRESRRLLP